MRRYTVIDGYESAYADPITLRAGQRVAFERRESEWDGWIWCTDDDGVGGWVPEAFVTIEESTAIAQLDCTARELTVRRGETVTGVDEVSGWVWAVSSEGASGWVPLRNLEPARGLQYRSLCPVCGHAVGRLSSYGCAPCPMCESIIRPAGRSVALWVAVIAVALAVPMVLSLAGLLHWYACLGLQGVILFVGTFVQPWFIPYRYVSSGRLCRGCGYDLVGIDAETCPECGLAVTGLPPGDPPPGDSE